MAHVHRQRFELLRQRMYSTSGTDVIEVGDLLYFATPNARPAAILTTADTVADAFIGIAMSAKPSTSQPEVRVAIDVVAEYPTSSGLGAAAPVGTKVEASISAGQAVNQVVVVNSASTDALGLLAKNAAAAATAVTVHFQGLHSKGPTVAD